MTITHYGDRARQATHCDVCGLEDARPAAWHTYGSVALSETCPQDELHACSPACAEHMQAKVDSGEWQVPIVRLRGYTATMTQPRKGY